MAEVPEQPEEKFAINILQPGIKGLNTLEDPTAIDNQEMADCRNMYFDNGMLTPRSGSVLFAEKPVGETNPALQLITATTADKFNYMVGVWGPNFYVWDSINEQWIQLNGNSSSPFIPVFTTLIHGYANWVKGFSLDKVYGGNGRDHSWSWQMGIGYLSVPALSSDTQITLSDSRRFPTSGILLLDNAGTLITLTITGNTVATGVVTISSGVGANVPIGSSVVMAMIDDNQHVPDASLFCIWQQRLVAANAYEAESLVNYSVTNDPEDFATTSGITGAGSFYITDGNGPITALETQGQYVMLGKRDTWIQFSFQPSADLSSKLTVTPPVVSGDSVGPTNPGTTISSENVLYYPTAVNGIYSLAPVTTSTTTTLQTKVLSEQINTTVTSVLSFINGQGTYYQSKLLWACGVPQVQTLNQASESAVKNTIVLLYDTIYQAWSFFDNWNVKGWTTYQNNLYYINNVDGNVYQCFVGQDDADVTYIPYAIFKEHDYDEPGWPKSQNLVYVAGLIDPGTQINVEVLFNRKGALGVQNFVIDGSANYVTSVPVIPLGGNAPLGAVPLGSGSYAKNQGLVNQLADNTGFFRVYLDCNYGFGFYTLQLKLSSQTLGAFWGILVVSHDPVLAPTYPTELVISPS